MHNELLPQPSLGGVSAAPDLPSPTILVIDDEPAILELVRDLLADEGYTVLSAADGHQGLVQAQRSTPHLILTDLMLPEVDGYALWRALRADIRTAKIPIVAMSAAYRPQDGIIFDAVLTKPFEIESLLRVIDTHLGSRP